MNSCKHCQKVTSNKKFCSISCQRRFATKEYLERWKQNLENGARGKTGLSRSIRKYLLDKVNYKCEECGWSKRNIYSDKIVLEVDHIDGNYLNNKEENLKVLCPNCHSLTKTYKGLNKGNGRTPRTI